MPADNTAQLIDSARRRHELTRAKAIQALRELSRARTPVTFGIVARTAEVSRSWLYSQPDIRTEIQQLRDTARQAPSSRVPIGQRASDPSLRRRLQAACERNRQLAEENRRLRRRSPRPATSTRETSHFDNDRTELTTPYPSHPASSRTLSSTKQSRSQPRPPFGFKITVESINARLRRAVNARGHFPTEQAALKCLCLAITSLDPTGRGRKRWTNRWKAALNAFDTFDGRLSAGRK